MPATTQPEQTWTPPQTGWTGFLSRSSAEAVPACCSVSAYCCCVRMCIVVHFLMLCVYSCALVVHFITVVHFLIMCVYVCWRLRAQMS